MKVEFHCGDSFSPVGSIVTYSEPAETLVDAVLQLAWQG